MKKIFICFVLTSLLLISDFALPANERFRSVTSGNWNSASTWEMSTNNGSTWFPATGTPGDTSGLINIRITNTVTVSVTVNADQLTIDSGGVLSVNSSIVLNILNGSGNDLTISSGGFLTGAGIVQTQGSVAVNVRARSNFNAALKINSGTATVTDQGSPFVARLYGNITIDTGATLNTGPSSSNTLYSYGNITNNGTITGTGINNTLRISGSLFTNNNSVTTIALSFDTVTTISGSGTYTGSNINVPANGNVSLSNNVTFGISGDLTVNAGGTFSPNSNILTMTSGKITLLSGGTVSSPGTVKTQGTVAIDPRNSTGFKANLNVASGTTTASSLASPWIAKLYGNITVDNGAVLHTNISSTYKLYIYGTLTNFGTITGGGGPAGISNTLGMMGSSFTNNGSITSPVLSFDSVTTVSGSGTYTGTNINVTANGNVTLSNNVTFGLSGDLTVNAGGTFFLNSNILTMTSGRITVLSGGTILSSGIVRTQGTVTIDPRNSAGFKADLNVASGTTTAFTNVSPWIAKLYGNITVDSGAVLQENLSSGYTLSVYGDVTNKGTITGPGSGNTLRILGSSLANNGLISSPVLSFDSVTTISGSGTYNGGKINVTAYKNLTLSNNVTLGISGDITVDTGGTFSLNSYILTMTSGRIAVLPGGTVSSPGIVKTQGTVAIDPSINSGFNADLSVMSGTTTVSSLSSSWTSRLNGDISIDTGAVLSINIVAYYTLLIFGNITNNGIISGGGNINFQSGSHILQGTGKWTTTANLVSGSNVTLNSSHQFFDVNIDSGATFNISNQTVKFSNTNPIIQNGTFTTTNSNVEYNGISFQYVSTANISYTRLRINNSAGAALLGDITIPDTLSIISGDLNLSGKIITLTPTAYMTEAPGNTVFGAGYITTTRSLNSPGGLNVAGMGAVLTQASDLGSTEIRRGHTIQSGLNGGYSIRRYFDILPANNSGLNATLVFKYDDSELNGKPEPALKLFKSTNSGSSWTKVGGTINIAANEITVSGINSFSRWTADSSGVSAAIALAMEGFYNTGTNNLSFSDTVKAYLRNTSAPYLVIDSARGIVDSLLFRCPFQFNAPTGNYYIELRHRNSLETWSKNPVSYIPGTTLNYDFTLAAAQAFGNNLKLKGTRYCLYSGDVTQNGYIDLEDVLEIYNASSTFQSGYSNTDVDGNFTTDLTDLVIGYNNSNLFAKTISPLNP